MVEQRKDEQTQAPECYACPIGTAFAAAQRSSPEATEHLIRAGRELVLAMRSMLDVATSFLEDMEARRGPSQDATIQRIDVKR